MDGKVMGCPVAIRDDFPIGVMVVVSGDGKQIIPIVNLDIEVAGTLPLPPGRPKIEYGQRQVTGTFEANFVDPDVYAKFLCGADSIAKLTMEAIVKLGDELAAKGKLNKHGRKHWRTHRKRMAAFVRREEARERRRAYGLATH